MLNTGKNEKLSEPEMARFCLAITDHLEAWPMDPALMLMARINRPKKLLVAVGPERMNFYLVDKFDLSKPLFRMEKDVPAFSLTLVLVKTMGDRFNLEAMVARQTAELKAAVTHIQAETGCKAIYGETAPAKAE